MSRPPDPGHAKIDRRTMLIGAGGLALATQVGACQAAAQREPEGMGRDAPDAAVAVLAALDPLRPEDFGASGRAGDDQTAALEKLMIEARRRGRARIVLRSGATYAGTNPFVWGGLRELLIEGNGARLMSARSAVVPGVFDANYAPFRSPTTVLPNGTEPLDFGPTQGSGKADFGVRLASAAKGATVLKSLDGTRLPAGPYLVHGWDRFGLDGMPPSPMCWEWVDAEAIPGARDRVRLSKPLRYAYDSQAPEFAYRSDPSLRYGAARALPLMRKQGRSRELVPMDLLAIRDIRFVANPRMQGQGGDTYNGVAGIGGARRILLERVSSERMFVNCAEDVTIRGAKVHDLEIDKFLGTVTLEGCELGSVGGAIGARDVIIGPGTRVIGGTWLAPTESLRARGATFAGDVGSTRALIGFYAHGSRTVTLDACTFEAKNPVVDRFVEAAFFTARFRLVAADQLALSRTEYDGSGIFRNLFVGAVFFDTYNRPAARVTRLPWCPDGNLLRGELRIGIEPLRRLGVAAQLRLPVIADLTMRDEQVTGPFAERVSTVFGTSPSRKANSLLAVVRGRELGARSIRLTSELTAVDQPLHSFYALLGRSFIPATLRFQVERAARGSSGPLEIGVDSDDGRELMLLRGVDLSRASAWEENLDARLAGAGILSLRVNDPSRALPVRDRARWALTVEGRFR